MTLKDAMAADSAVFFNAGEFGEPVVLVVDGTEISGIVAGPGDIEALIAGEHGDEQQDGCVWELPRPAVEAAIGRRLDRGDIIRSVAAGYEGDWMVDVASADAVVVQVRAKRHQVIAAGAAGARGRG